MSDRQANGETPSGAAGAVTAPGDARPAKLLMAATYLVGIVGLFIGFTTITADPPSLTWSVLLVVVFGGGLSFVRHSLFPGSDAVRLGWTSKQRNNFQIEVGIANFAWAAVALLSIVLDWGLQVQAATLLTFGIYLAGSSTMLLLSSRDDRARSLGPVLGMAAFGVMQIVLGVMGMNSG